MLDKGLNEGDYIEPCRRALFIANQINDNPKLIERAWLIAKVQRRNIDSHLQVAAITMWLARGREVYKGRDGLIRAKGTVLIKPISKLMELIGQVEKTISRRIE